MAAAIAESFVREPLPRLCNLDRLLHAMTARGLDGIVATLPHNVFYLTSFNGVAHKADEPRPYAVMFSRAAPEHPVLVVADYYLATFLAQPTWVAGHPAVSRRDDAAGPAAAARGHRPLHPGRGARASTGSSTPARATASTWGAPCAAPCAISSSSAAGSRSTTWASASGSASRISWWSTATIR